jgi:hypothetical protein
MKMTIMNKAPVSGYYSLKGRDASRVVLDGLSQTGALAYCMELAAWRLASMRTRSFTVDAQSLTIQEELFKKIFHLLILCLECKPQRRYLLNMVLLPNMHLVVPPFP